MITPAQSRAGRALINWSQEELATGSHLGISTIRDFEKGRRVPTHNNLAAIKTALEKAGVEFIENGVKEVPGIHLSRLTVPSLQKQIDADEQGRGPSEE